MKQFTAILLSFVIFVGSLFPKADALQLAKVGELVKHYNQHKNSWNENISFLEFLAMHYSATSKHFKTAKHSHSNLPNLNSHNTTTLCEPTFDKKIVLPFVAIFKVFSEPNFVWKNFYRFSIVQTLFNPPRF
ncbi:hypothetical protein VB264_04120 [Arcicella aquatica]|uniref:Uncharacterized protein n=1 Tax=Arcicella aquatica TaxID=217141 RepID=A0ABU5QIU0_9BACT|nr:hypothetical protein [Arcicella aquatica]MEA5256958.1 hypothetical protein [Arcicella aquatica]